MKRRKKQGTWMFLSVAPLLAAWGVAAGFGFGTPAVALEACEVRFSPTAVATGQDQVSVSVSFSEAIGSLDRVEAESGSGIETEAFDPAAATLALSTGSAVPGTWVITFTDSAELECAGNIAVVEGGSQDVLREPVRISPAT